MVGINLQWNRLFPPQTNNIIFILTINPNLLRFIFDRSTIIKSGSRSRSRRSRASRPALRLRKLRRFWRGSCRGAKCADWTYSSTGNRSSSSTSTAACRRCCPSFSASWRRRTKNWTASSPCDFSSPLSLELWEWCRWNFVCVWSLERERERAIVGRVWGWGFNCRYFWRFLGIEGWVEEVLWVLGRGSLGIIMRQLNDTATACNGQRTLSVAQFDLYTSQ